MKKNKIISLGLLSFLLFSCNNTKKPNSDNPNNDNPSEDVDSEKSKTVIGRWKEKLVSPFKLSGRAVENITTTSQEHDTERFKEVRAYSQNKFYAISDLYNTASNISLNTAMKYCCDNDGNLSFKYLNENNEIISTTINDDSNKPITFSGIYVNPFLCEYDYDFIQIDNDPHSFTLIDKSDDDDVDIVDEICQNITMLKVDFSSIVFTENESLDQLSIKIKAENQKQSDYTASLSYEFTLSEITQAFPDPLVFKETEEHKKLDNALKDLSNNDSYTIKRTSYNNYLGTTENWNVFVEKDKTFNEQTQDGILKNSDDKYYQYSYNRDYMMTLSDPIDQYDDNSYKYRPVYNNFSPCVFKHNTDSKTGEITYMLQTSLEDFVQEKIVCSLLEDKSTKEYAAKYLPSNLKIILDKDNNLKITYSILRTTSEGGGTIYFSDETYTFDNQGKTTAPQFTEQIPSDIKDISWEVVTDPSSSDTIEQNGLSVKLTLDSQNNPTIEFTLNNTPCIVSNITVQNGIVTFESNSKNYQITYFLDKDSKNVNAFIQCTSDNSKKYKLTEVGVKELKDDLIGKIDSIDPNDYNDVLDGYSEKTDKEYIASIKKEALKYVSEANTKADAQAWFDAWIKVIKTTLSIYQNNALDEIYNYKKDLISKATSTKRQQCYTLQDTAIENVKNTHTQSELTTIVSNYKAGIDNILNS